MELTKEYFDEQTQLTKEYFNNTLEHKLGQKLAPLEDRVAAIDARIEYLDDGLESLKGIIATKGDIQEIKDKLDRLDTRTDEDIKAVIKDVEMIKAAI